jgi:metal-dependent amidase/aminoacylase/carboxypeptidase family protein
LSFRKTPFTWEGFWTFTQHFSGAMFGLGSGTDTALHNPDYDFPDEIIPTGITYFIKLVNKF